MIKIVYFINEILSNFYGILLIQSIAFCVKAYLLWAIVLPGWHKDHAKKPLLFLTGLLIGSMAVDATWILWFVRKLFIPSINYTFVLFFIRLSWALVLVQYQSLALFLESLFEFEYKLPLYQKVFLGISSLFTIFFAYSAVVNAFLGYRTPLEYFIVKGSSFYMLGPLMMITLLVCIRKLMVVNLPKILRKQIKLIIKYLIVPFVLADVIQLLPFSITSQGTGHFSTIALSTSLITYAMFYSCRKIMGLRFLNLEEAVQSNKRFIFIKDFKNVLEQMSMITHMQELKHISSSFFNDCFGVPSTHVILQVRYSFNSDQQSEEPELVEALEELLNSDDQESRNAVKMLQEKKIWVYDEIDFTDFYQRLSVHARILRFMNTIQADIFLPIFQNNTIIGALMVKRAPRNYNFYGNDETDQMVVFAGYVAYIINLLENYTVDQLLAHKKSLKEQLHIKHEEIAHYKESMRSIIRQTDDNIGVMYYKNGKFTYGNTYAQQLITLKLNSTEVHPLANSIKELVATVEHYKSSESKVLVGKDNKKIMCTCMPDTLDDRLILLVHSLGISEILKEKIAHLPEATEWDYLYYLETTKSGTLINQLIPGGKQQLISFKIELIKAALSTKALFLDIPQEDLSDVAQIIHDISLRQKLFTIDLTPYCDEVDLSIKLFGLNALYGDQKSGLLAELDGCGTLFIRNIEFLPFAIQNKLAHYIHYGFYSLYKSEKKKQSHVRILVSASRGLQNLVSEQKISNDFYQALQHSRLLFPSLLTLPEQEMDDLASGMARQVDDNCHLTQEEIILLQAKGITSLSALRHHIHQFIQTRADSQQKGEVWSCVDSSLDEDVKMAMKLGKNALKDKELMKKLLDKFNNQNQLALLLGVDRSSINRRIKQHQLDR